MNHVLQGLGDCLRRYAAVFGAAWTNRHAMQSPPRTAEEIEFLPAHLELMETPVSPAARWTLRLIIAFFCIALLWACLGKVDIVAVAPGKIVASGRTKVIQPAETAVVTRIHVRDGQQVPAGQLLIELDATGARTDVTQADASLLDAQLARLRLQAVRDAIANGQPPRLQPDPALPADRWQAEQQLASSEYAAWQQKREGLQAGIAQRQAEIATLQAMLAPLAETVRIARVREDDYARLVTGQYVGRHDYLLRQQERIAAESQLATQRNRLQEARSALQATREELDLLVADFRRQTLDQLRQAEEQVRQSAPELLRTRQRDRQLALRAPVAGTVQQLAVHTVGGVVTPAQPLLAIVPGQDTLEVEAVVLNRDIGFVRAGQSAMVKIDSFPYTRYGYLQGTVASVSHDATQDEQLGLVFPARVVLQRDSVAVNGVPVRLSPGMSLSVEIRTGQRRIIGYLLSPLQQHAGEALRER